MTLATVAIDSGMLIHEGAETSSSRRESQKAAVGAHKCEGGDDESSRRETYSLQS